VFRAGYLLDLDWQAMDHRQAQEAVTQDGTAPYQAAQPEAEAEAG